MKILYHYGLDLQAVHSLEREILTRFDVAVMVQPTYYDIIRETEGLALGSSGEHLRFFNFMDNYMLYVLINQGFGVCVDLHYLAAIMFYCHANHIIEGTGRFVALVKREYTPKLAFTKHLNSTVEQLAKNLIVLGNNETTVQSISSTIDIKQLSDWYRYLVIIFA